MNLTLNINNGRVKTFPIKDIDTRGNFCKNIPYPTTTKNYNGAVAMRKKLYDVNGTNKSTN